MWEGTAPSGSSRAKASPGHGHHPPLRQAGSSLSVPAPPHQGQPRGHSACASHPHSQRGAEAVRTAQTEFLQAGQDLFSGRKEPGLGR